MTTAFYTVAWFVCFYAYKEFAAMLQDMMAGGGAQMQAGIPGFGQQMGGGQQTVGYVVDNRPKLPSNRSNREATTTTTRLQARQCKSEAIADA